MLTHSIKKQYPIKSTRKEILGKPPTKTNFGETPTEVFERHFIRCLFKEGDHVVFKKPRRRRIHGVVTHIETDINKMQWVAEATVPRYIKVRVPVIDRKTGEITGMDHVWTTESKLTFEAAK